VIKAGSKSIVVNFVNFVVNFVDWDHQFFPIAAPRG